MQKLKVGILGATGLVGQRFVQLLANHPWFKITELTASSASSGRTYREAATWRLETAMPEQVADLVVKEVAPPLDCQLVFSALGSEVAEKVEPAFAKAGYAVISNASSFRMGAHVPLLVPEINLEHLQLLGLQKNTWGNARGCIVTNPNCVTAELVIGLAPLHARWGVEQVFVVTMQALSGAGIPGPSALDIVDNVIPFIGGEETKIESEPRKILGSYVDGVIKPADFRISSMVNRVAVADGHLASVSVKLRHKPAIAELKACLREYCGFPQTNSLPTAPEQLIQVFDEPDRPQPKRDRQAGRGMTVSIGHVRECAILDYKFTLLGHNTIRGAAGATILIAESMQALGHLG